MRKILIVMVALVAVAGPWASLAEACGRPIVRPKPLMCSAGAVGSISSAANGQATVRFSSRGGSPLASSRGMTLAPTEGCACAIAVRKSPGVDVTGVIFPTSYPGFSLAAGTVRAQNTAAFVKHYLALDGKNPEDYEIVIFTTVPGVSIPFNVNFDVDVEYAIPSGSNGEEIAQALGVIGFFGYDGDRVFVEPSEGDTHISFAEYLSPGFDLTEAAVFLAETSMPSPASVQAAALSTLDTHPSRNFDARAGLQVEHKALDLVHRPELLSLKARFPALRTSTHEYTGAVRTLNRPIGFLTPEDATGRLPREIALDFVRQEIGALGLTDEDLEERELTDEVVSSVTGATHLYWRQLLEGIPVYNGQLHVNVDRDGRVMSVNNAFVPNLRRAANALQPRLDGGEAVAKALGSLGIEASPVVMSIGADPRQTTRVAHEGISREPIEAALMLLPVNAGNARLVWNFQIQTLDGDHWYDMNVDAINGTVWTRFDWVSDATYRVFPRPVESPNHGSRALLTDPFDATASPFGWHDTGSSSFTGTQGNNVRAYEDRNGNNVGTPVSCGPTIDCDFPLDLSLDPSQYIPAAVTNLFYWNNTIHDIQYNFGFDEQAGNFQENNFGLGGSGSDSVNADAQDGSGTNNANFATPPDGWNPRMQMFIWTAPDPDKDGDLDNGIIIHEYGHGISIRQVGGPSNSSCLNNSQQPGEGWSDWFALAYTAEAGDASTDVRGIGTYVLDEPTTGTGIRGLPYSTDNSINNWTYESITGMSIPHGVGSVWAQAIWEVYWALVVKHGFDEDLGNRNDAAGNHRAMLYINEGLKNTACSPTFLETRDGIIQAAQNLFGGEDVCTLWEAFAAFGLGTDATTGGSNSTTATNGFNVPPECPAGPKSSPPCPPRKDAIDFNTLTLTSYSDQNVSNNVSIADDGDTLVLGDNTWIRSIDTFDVTQGTRLQFFFAGGPQGEIHAMGLDADDTLNDEPAHFQLWGIQNWTGAGNAGRTSPQYSGSGDFEPFDIPAGASLGTGPMSLVFTNDNDAGSGNEGRFANVRVVHSPVPSSGACTVSDDFSGGAMGWFNDGASTCTTGSYVLGTPTLVTNGGVTTQVGGDHTSGSGTAIFTAVNSSAGVDDVDGGNCILRSPTWNVIADSELSVWYFHGQRDAGNDPSGDFFLLEVSTDGGSTWSTLASNGDSTLNAAWTNATASIPAGSSVQLRVKASDGVTTGDLVEAGIDDVSICPLP